MSALLSVAFLVQILRISVPYALAALGGTFSERGGVVNIALEGIMLAGAFAFVLATWGTGSAWLGLVGGIAGGMLVAALLALVVVRLGADAVVTGVAINLLAVGATRYAMKIVWDSSSNSERVEAIEPLAGGEGALGAIASLATHPLFWIALLLVAVSPLLLYRTRFGLRLRACGEHPEAAATVGVRVRWMRLQGVLISGALAGLAGVWLAADQHQFTDNMTNGRGYIALAAMIFGKWDPWAAAGACVLFGAAEALQIALQSQGIGIPTQFLQMIPYLLTIVALVGFVGRAVPPAASGKPFEG